MQIHVSGVFKNMEYDATVNNECNFHIVNSLIPNSRI